MQGANIAGKMIRSVKEVFVRSENHVIVQSDVPSHQSVTSIHTAGGKKWEQLTAVYRQ